MEEEILNKKWEKLLKLAEKFQHIPFVEFAIVSGSMATGEADENSDFDFIIGCRPGRIFTARQLASGLFELTGNRRKRESSEEEVKDKVCLNHFVTPEGYRLGPPHNEYWIYLYQNLVPVYGNKKSIEKFFKANEWAGEIEVDYNLQIGKQKSFLKKAEESILKGKLGDFIEKIFKKYQIRRIERNLKESKGYKPLLKYNDTELRFHMDTRRIEEWIERNR